MTHEEVEAEMAEKGLTAPTITDGHIEDLIVKEAYLRVEGTTTTLCVLELLNGMTIIGQSACVSPSNFDAELGQKIARDDAKRKVWELEGYLLRQRMTFGQVEWIADSMIAKIAHEVNRVWCAYNGDDSQPTWEAAPDWQKDSAMNGVRFHRTCPDAGPQQSHENWLSEKLEDGWVYGEVKNPETKEHPCCVPFDQLPREQQFKDILFKTIANAALIR